MFSHFFSIFFSASRASLICSSSSRSSESSASLPFLTFFSSDFFSSPITGKSTAFLALPISNKSRTLVLHLTRFLNNTPFKSFSFLVLLNIKTETLLYIYFAQKLYIFEALLHFTCCQLTILDSFVI